MKKRINLETYVIPSGLRLTEAMTSIYLKELYAFKRGVPAKGSTPERRKELKQVLRAYTALKRG